MGPDSTSGPDLGPVQEHPSDKHTEELPLVISDFSRADFYDVFTVPKIAPQCFKWQFLSRVWALISAMVPTPLGTDSSAKDLKECPLTSTPSQIIQCRNLKEISGY